MKKGTTYHATFNKKVQTHVAPATLIRPPTAPFNVANVNINTILVNAAILVVISQFLWFSASQSHSSQMKMEEATSYGADYFEKDFSKPKPIYSATSSGYRRNNPHPSREFMEWKIPRGGAREEQVVLDEAKLREVFKKQLTTSYQVS